MKFKSVLLTAGLVLGVISVICLISIYYLSLSKFDEEWVIGKTVSEVIEKYGEFDYYYSSKDLNDSISKGGYIIKPEKVGYLGTTPAIYFRVIFDEHGVAYKCYKGPSIGA